MLSFKLYSYVVVFILTSNYKFLGGFQMFGYFQTSIKNAAVMKNSRYMKATQFLIANTIDIFQLYSSKDDSQNDDFFYVAGFLDIQNSFCMQFFFYI